MRRFDVSTDLETINEWLVHRKLQATSERELPYLGYIVPGVAAGFLRMCEGGFAIIDSLVTNPGANPSERNQALNDIYAQLINDSESLGIKRLMGFTLDANTLERSLSHGFIQAPYAVLSRSS